MVWVFPGRFEILAKFLRPVSILISEDLPTLDRPIKANSGLSGKGQWLICVLLMTNSAVLMIMDVLKVLIEGQNTKNVTAARVMGTNFNFNYPLILLNCFSGNAFIN